MRSAGYLHPTELHRPGANREQRRLPKSVALCSNQGNWTLSVWTFSRSEPALKTRVPYRCKSWRCEGHCATFDRRLTYARIREAISRDRLSHDGWTLWVLTLDRLGTFSGKRRWKDTDEAFRDLSRMSRRLLEKLRGWMRKQGMRPVGREWLAVVEAHRSGWPHINFMIWSPELAEHVEREQRGLGPEFERLGFHAATVPGELGALTRSAGWGVASTVERVRSEGKVLNYMTKLAGEAGQALGEISKLTQLPYNAPQRFRRLRSGKGWLPKRRKNPDVTGGVMARQHDKYDGSRVVMPVYTTKDPALVAHLAEIAYEETRLWEREIENAPALREACERLVLPAVSESLPAPAVAALVEARRRAVAELYAELGTPLRHSVLLPVKDVPPFVVSTGPPRAAGPPVPANDVQLSFGDFDDST